jgi:hypothetical protein
MKQKSKSDTDIAGSRTMDSEVSTESYSNNHIAYDPGRFNKHSSHHHNNALERRGHPHETSTSTVSTILGGDALLDMEDGKVRHSFFDSGFGSDKRVTSGAGRRGRTRTVTVSERPGSTTETTTASASPQEYG